MIPIRNRKASTIRSVLLQHLSLPCNVRTDEFSSYPAVFDGVEYISHKTCCHKTGFINEEDKTDSNLVENLNKVMKQWFGRMQGTSKRYVSKDG